MFEFSGRAPRAGLETLAGRRPTSETPALGGLTINKTRNSCEVDIIILTIEDMMGHKKG